MASAPLFLLTALLLAFAAASAGEDLPMLAAVESTSSSCSEFRQLILHDFCGDLQPTLKKVTQACCVAAARGVDGNCVCPAILKASRRVQANDLTGLCDVPMACLAATGNAAADGCAQSGLSAVGKCVRELQALQKEERACLCKLDEKIEAHNEEHACLAPILAEVGTKSPEAIHALCRSDLH